MAAAITRQKNPTGKGGMVAALLINDQKLIERAEVIREKGTNRAQFFRGEVDKYTWRDVGSSYLPSDILAAFLFVQLECRDHIQTTRQRIWNYYHDCLLNWADENGVSIPFVPSYCQQAYHMFYLLLPSLQKRTMLISHLKDQGIHSVFHYQPLHLAPMGRKWGYKEGGVPVTEDVSDQLVRLPFYNDLQEDEQEQVCKAIKGARL